MRAWLYCRVANGWDSDSSDHLALQKTELERYCQEHDMAIVGTTTVTGSGKDELWELVHSAAEQDAFDVLAAVSISRVGGDLLAIRDLCQVLNKSGKGMCFVRDNLCVPSDLLTEQAQHFDTSSEMGGQSL
jgi:DNA invertase Pin-like site-specific DNA recombinase